MINLVEKLRLKAQSLPISLESWITAFAGIVLIRIFFEQFSSFIPQHFIVIDLPTILHYTAFFLATIILLMIILIKLGRISLKEASVMSIFGLLILWTVPLIDLGTAGVGGHILSYPFLHLNELGLRFITFFGGHINLGATLGVQIEIFTVILACGLYVYTSTKNILRSIGASLAFYCLIFLLGSVPSLIAFFVAPQSDPTTVVIQSMISSHILENNIHPEFSATYTGLANLAFNKTMLGVYTLISVVSVAMLFFIAERKKFLALMKNCRPERVLHLFLLFIFGSALAYTGWFTSWIDIQSYLLALIAFFCATMFSICQNDLHDESIDSISNPNRPLISKEVSRGEMGTASKIFLALSILSAYASSHYILFFVSVFLFIYFIYSNPPLRLKRFTIISSFLVSLACLSVVLAGFFLLSAEKNIIAFPFSLAVAIVFFYTIISNVRDIKDERGDRENGIKTLPVLLGIEKAKKVIAGSGSVLLLAIPWYFHNKLLIVPSIVASILSSYFILRKDYKEWKVFVVYLTYFVFIICAVVLK